MELRIVRRLRLLRFAALRRRLRLCTGRVLELTPDCDPRPTWRSDGPASIQSSRPIIPGALNCGMPGVNIAACRHPVTIAPGTAGLISSSRLMNTTGVPSYALTTWHVRSSPRGIRKYERGTIASVSFESSWRPWSNAGQRPPRGTSSSNTSCHESADADRMW